ncbi:MAG TPA: discoidin domain-containing protein, partial [Sedimentisphaerales bacterium]|nr:discoidin domain-containing protein [Sedimentisphaerales bacterium]
MLKKNIIIDVSLAILLLGSTVVQGRLLLYEPFDYTVGQKVDGQTPPDGMGMIGSWIATDNNADRDQLVVESDGGVDGPGGANDPVPDVKWDGAAANIPQKGHFISIGGNGHVFGHITLASSVTDTFVDGSTTWMSCVSAQTDSPWGYWPLLAIGAGELQEDRGDTAAGQAIGGGAYYQDNRNGLIGAHYWDDEDGNASYEIHASAGTVDFYTPQLLVFKITWSDAGNDTVNVYSFDVSAGAPAPTEAAFDAGAVWNSANLGQSQLDTLSYAGGRFELDEIRIGTTFSDVVSGTTIAPIASNPNPPDSEADVPRDVVLSWTPGEHANTHDVYLGTLFDDVNDAGRSDPRGVLGSQNQTDTTYDPPGRLDFGQTYYWRIDEVNAPPDSTIFKGTTWSFTTEPVGYPVAGQTITVTASSADTGQGPENTVNGSGLADDLHSDELTAMWLTALGATGPAWIQYEFDRVYKLHQMWVWNHNGLLEPMIGFGCKEVTIEYSANGTDYTALGTTHEFARATGKVGYAHNTVVDFGGITAKYVRLTVNSNWGGILKQYGLSEVRFLSIPVLAREPNPISGATDVGVDVTLNWRSGREAARHDVYLSADEQAV